nr:MAG TPA: hypothetical protein [Crassvirales sp.]
MVHAAKVINLRITTKQTNQNSLCFLFEGTDMNA